MRLALFVAALMLTTGPAQAFCAYKGIIYYQPSLQEEYADSAMVVRATVLRERSEEKIADKLNRDWRSYYTLKVTQTFKGKPPAIPIFVTEHNSGGFYLDIGKEYLLFLNPARPEYKDVPTNAVVENSNCGQSKKWNDASTQDREKLDELVKHTLEPGYSKWIAAPSARR